MFAAVMLLCQFRLAIEHRTEKNRTLQRLERTSKELCGWKIEEGMSKEAVFLAGETGPGLRRDKSGKTSTAGAMGV